jgi:hypothetical protein
MKLTNPVLLMVLAGMLTALAQTPDKNQAIVTLDQGLAYEATSLDSRWVARIFVTPAQPQDSQSLVAEIKGVSAGARSDPGLTAMFEAPSPTIENGRLVSFDLATRKGVDLPHGAYNILLTFSSGESHQLSTVQLTIPVAVLAPAHLLITRVLPFLGAGGGGETPTLILRETGGRSPAKVQFAPDRFSDANGEYSGQLVLPAVTVPQGQQVHVPYTVEGDFPLGAAKANLTLMSYQLDSPSIVAVEVRTRRTRIVLLILVAAGLILGFLMRTVLKQQIQFGEARELAIDELHKLKQECDAASDDEYRDALERIMVPLVHQIERARTSRVSDLAGAVTTAEAALKTASDALKARSDEAAAALKAVAEVVETRWSVPEPAATQLRISQAALPAVREALRRGNVAEATHGLDGVVATLRSALGETVRSYRASYEGLIADLAEVGTLLLPDAQQDFQAAVKQLQDLAKAMPDVDPLDDSAKLKTLLGAMSQSGSAAESLLAGLDVKVVQTYAAMDAELGPVALPQPAEWSAASEATRGFAASLPDVADNPAKNSPVMRQQALDLKRRWWAALASQAPDPSPAFAFFDQGKYKEAADSIAGIIRGAPKPKLMGIMPAAVAAPPVARPLRLASHAVATEDVPLENPYRPRSTSDTIRAIETRTFRELLAAKLAQWIISAVGLAIIGYLLFADKFVGTGPEMLTAFFWGFTTDVGLDALISAGKPKQAG